MEYDNGGVKEDKGSASHSAVINALKAFQKFIKSQENSASEPENKTNVVASVPSDKADSTLMVDPKEAIGDDYIICCICGEKRQALTSKHLSLHGLTLEEYKKLCGYAPDQPLMSRGRFEHTRAIFEQTRAIVENANKRNE